MAFTFFFRDIHTLEQLAENFMPFINGLSKVKIWDAGCAMGQEPYTFAIVLAERMGYFAFKKILIDASDIDENNTFCKIIAESKYPYNELERIPKELFEKYFIKSDTANDYQLNDTIRSKLKFHKHDLLSLKPFDSGYHLIICKNVLLHFHPEERIEVLKMYHSSLVTGGFLTTEQTQKMPVELNNYFTQVSTNANIFKKLELE